MPSRASPSATARVSGPNLWTQDQQWFPDRAPAQRFLAAAVGIHVPRTQSSFKHQEQERSGTNIPMSRSRSFGWGRGCQGWSPNIGECLVSSTFPLPRYICTPQGRQGSKLRTARIISIPLNFSGPFSSKIGVFCTASSYGPGVPYTSRGLAFQGVGGYG